MQHESLMLELGAPAPAFVLPDPSGHVWTLDSFASARLLCVAFICNHCPFVLHMLDGFVQFAVDYLPRGVATVAISSNDVASYPADSPDRMAALARDRRFGFPYLYDESQDVAARFGAVCTPDLFLYDERRTLAYRGRFDPSRPARGAQASAAVPVTGAELRAAADALLGGRAPSPDQQPSIGCSMKWKPGMDPDERRTAGREARH